MCAFDCPECSQRAPRRDSTTTALQALTMLNGPFIAQQSALFAERVKRDSGPSADTQVIHAFQLAFNRQPNTKEGYAALTLIKDQGLVGLCRALLNANEFMYY